MARTSSLISVARRLEAARTKLWAAVAAKQKELAELDGALRRVLGVSAGTANGHVARKTGGRGRTGRRAATGGRKARNGGAPGAGTLAATIVEVLNGHHGKSATIADVLKGAKKAGYKSKAAVKTQRIMVNQTLSKLVKGGLVTKVSRGKYAGKA